MVAEVGSQVSYLIPNAPLAALQKTLPMAEVFVVGLPQGQASVLDLNCCNTFRGFPLCRK